MNIFYLDHDVSTCAKMHVDKHVCKMVIEYAQLLSTTHRVLDGEMYIDIIVSEFDKIGYKVIHKVFKCEEYNVPQKRERLIILGVKKDNPHGWVPQFPNPQSNNLNLISIINYDMTGAVKVDPEWFNEIPNKCILTNMNDNNRSLKRKLNEIEIDNQNKDLQIEKLKIELQTETQQKINYERAYEGLCNNKK